MDCTNGECPRCQLEQLLDSVEEYGLDARVMFYLKLIVDQFQVSWSPGEEIPGRPAYTEEQIEREPDLLMKCAMRRTTAANADFPHWIEELYGGSSKEVN